jgi:mannose-6-phosphate isomerase-like protein (cupin superfamily)
MDHDMVCHITAGEFKITQGDMEFMLKEGDMYTCSKGKPESSTNTGNTVGVHRNAILISP